MDYVLTTDPVPRALGRSRATTPDFFLEAFRPTPPAVAPAAPAPPANPGMGHNNPPPGDLPGATALGMIREAMHKPAAPVPGQTPVIVDPEVIQAAGELLAARKAEKNAKAAVDASRGTIMLALSAEGVSPDGKPVPVALAGKWRITAQHVAATRDKTITPDMVGQVVKGREESWRVAVEPA